MGAFGHLGTSLITLLLDQGCPVRAFDLRKKDNIPANPFLACYEGDVTKPETLEPLFSGLAEGSFIVVYLAAIIDIGAMHQTAAMNNVNINGVKNSFRFFEEKKGFRFIYVSSVDAFLQTQSLCDENSPLVEGDEAAGYPMSKAEATRFVLAKRRAGVDAIVVYPSGIIGPYDDGRNHLIQLLRDYLNGKIPGVIPGGYDMVDVRDVAYGIYSLSSGPSRGDSFILSGHRISLKELLLLAKAWNHGVGKKVPVYPCWVAYLGLPFIALYCKVFHKRPLCTVFAIDIVRHANTFSHVKATRVFGYDPRPLERSVDDSLDYLCSQGLLEKKK
ncbi:MAG: NAD-dependent epimerase/dehydratase family protein [Bacilli bacterium]